MGQGVVTKSEATHTYHKGLSHADWLAQGCGTWTLHWVSSPGCAGCPPEPEQTVRVTDTGSPDWSHSDWCLIKVT